MLLLLNLLRQHAYQVSVALAKGLDVFFSLAARHDTLVVEDSGRLMVLGVAAADH